MGSRHLREDSLKDWALQRLILTHISYALTSFLLRMPHDATTAYRLYKLDQIPRQIFDLVQSKSYPFFFESLCILQANGMTIKDVPITLPARTLGNSKMLPRDVACGAWRLFCLCVLQVLAPERLRLAAPAVSAQIR